MAAVHQDEPGSGHQGVHLLGQGERGDAVRLAVHDEDRRADLAEPARAVESRGGVELRLHGVARLALITLREIGNPSSTNLAADPVVDGGPDLGLGVEARKGSSALITGGRETGQSSGSAAKLRLVFM